MFDETLEPRLRTALPDAPSPELSDRYAFIDTKKVVDDMKDLGYYVAGFRYPTYRTISGAFSLHEVDFRKLDDINRPKGETPRVLFLNSYDGSRRAQVISGVFRLVCLNGLIAGETHHNEKFLHVGDYAEELVSQIRDIGHQASVIFDDLEKFKSQKLDDHEARKMARKALDLRDPGSSKYDIEPDVALMPRRQADTGSDLWTRWNVLQENLSRGGIPSTSADGKVRITREITQISKSNRLNRGLWDLLEETSGTI